MYLFLIDQFATALESVITAAEEAIRESTDAYGVAAVACALTGVSLESPYQSMPGVHPRTVRRVLAGAGESVRMCMSSISFQKEQVHKDSNESAVLDGIREIAEGCKVAPGIAEVAVTRYGNSPERVMRVLDGITALLAEGCKVFNPTGLFTRLMRSGQEVKLPTRVVQARQEARKAKEVEAAKIVPEVGMLVKLYGEVCRIVGLTRQFAEIETKDGMVNVARDNLRFVAT